MKANVVPCFLVAVAQLVSCVGTAPSAVPGTAPPDPEQPTPDASTTEEAAAALPPPGAVDATFIAPTLGFSVERLIVDAGRVYVFGFVPSGNGSVSGVLNVAALSQDGRLDGSFGVQTVNQCGADESFADAAVSPNAVVIVTRTGCIVRLRATGEFVGSTRVADVPRAAALALDGTGAVFVAGSVAGSPGPPKPRIARVSASGDVINTFSTTANESTEKISGVFIDAHTSSFNGTPGVLVAHSGFNGQGSSIRGYDQNGFEKQAPLEVSSDAIAMIVPEPGDKGRFLVGRLSPIDASTTPPSRTLSLRPWRINGSVPEAVADAGAVKVPGLVWTPGTTVERPVFMGDRLVVLGSGRLESRITGLRLSVGRLSEAPQTVELEGEQARFAIQGSSVIVAFRAQNGAWSLERRTFPKKNPP